MSMLREDEYAFLMALTTVPDTLCIEDDPDEVGIQTLILLRKRIKITLRANMPRKKFTERPAAASIVVVFRDHKPSISVLLFPGFASGIPAAISMATGVATYLENLQKYEGKKLTTSTLTGF